MIQSWFDLMVDGDVFVAPWCIMLMTWCLHAYPPKIMRQQICFSMSRNQSNCAVVLFPGHQWRQWWPSLGNLWWILLKNDATKGGHVHKCAASYSVLFLWKIYDIQKSTTSWWFQSIWKVYSSNCIISPGEGEGLQEKLLPALSKCHWMDPNALWPDSIGASLERAGRKITVKHFQVVVFFSPFLAVYLAQTNSPPKSCHPTQKKQAAHLAHHVLNIRKSFYSPSIPCNSGSDRGVA